MAVYQDKALERIRGGLRKMSGVIERGRAAKLSESDTRTIVQSVLSELLGWDRFTELTGEYRIRGNYADFALRTDEGIFAVIEVKALGTKLGAKHLYQASGYAVNEGVDWIILTDGDVWQLYRVTFAKPIQNVLVFEVRISDTDTKPADRAALLYLLSKEAQRKQELDAYYNKKAALCGPNIAKVILSESVLTKIRSEVRAVTGHRVPLDELATLLAQDVLRADVQSDETAKLIRKAAIAANRKSTTAV